MQTGLETPRDSASLPLLHYRTDELRPVEACAQWRQLMAPLFHVKQASYTSALPRGNLSVFIVGEIMVNRCTFNAQHISRDPALIAATPDHLVLQYYRSGGFRGTIAGKPVCIVRRQVAVADLSQEIDAYAATSDTIGLSVPRALLTGIDPSALRTQLDPLRNQALGGYMASLPRRLGRAGVAAIPHVSQEIVDMLARIFAAGPLEQDSGPSAVDDDLPDRFARVVEAELAAPGLSPTLVADRLGMSRAAIYRLLAPMGGIMRYIQERRLQVAKDCLSDSLDGRSIAEIAAAHGFTSQTVFSRAFQARFGSTPRLWRRQQAEQDRADREPSPGPAHVAWRDLGRSTRD